MHDVNRCQLVTQATAVQERTYRRNLLRQIHLIDPELRSGTDGTMLGQGLILAQLRAQIQALGEQGDATVLDAHVDHGTCADVGSECATYFYA